MNDARKLKLCRKQNRLTQGALAEMFGISTNAICRMEQEKTEIPANIKAWMDKQVLVDPPQGDVGQRISELRKELKMTRNQFAEYVGCTGPTISRLENGKNQIERPLAIKIAEKCNVGVDWLLTGDEDKKMWPVDSRLITWLWEHEDEREKLWEKVIGDGA